MAKKKRWTEKEIDILNKEHNSLTLKEISNLLDRSTFSIAHKLSRGRLSNQIVSKKWNTKEIKLLKDNYLIKSDVELSKLLNRSTKSISSKRVIMNFVRPKEWMSNNMKRNNPMFNEETTKKVSNTLKRKYTSREVVHPNLGRKRPDLIMMNKDPNFQKKCHQFKRPNNPENILMKIIKQSNLPFNYTGNGVIWFKGKTHSFNPDFLSKNPKHIIEVFGDYWHNLPKRKKLDKERLQTYKKYGYKTLVIWEHELKDSTQVIEKINKFIGGN